MTLISEATITPARGDIMEALRMEELTFLEKLALERAEMIRLIEAAKVAAAPNIGLPRDVNRKVRSLLSEVRIDEAQQVVMDYLDTTAPTM